MFDARARRRRVARSRHGVLIRLTDPGLTVAVAAVQPGEDDLAPAGDFDPGVGNPQSPRVTDELVGGAHQSKRGGGVIAGHAALLI